jgi:cytochrome bd-type quinol oxidase subunit 1
VVSVFTLAALHWSGIALVKYQPMKFAAIESIRNTEHAGDFLLFALPHMGERSNRHEIAIPGLLGLMAGEADLQVRGLDALTDE